MDRDPSRAYRSVTHATPRRASLSFQSPIVPIIAWLALLALFLWAWDNPN